MNRQKLWLLLALTLVPLAVRAAPEISSMPDDQSVLAPKASATDAPQIVPADPGEPRSALTQELVEPTPPKDASAPQSSSKTPLEAEHDELIAPVDRGDEKKVAVWHFQEPATEVMSTLVKTHNLMFSVVFAIFVLVCIALVYIVHRFAAKRNPVPATFSHNTKLEVIWTLIPLVIVLLLEIPSLRALYKAETLQEPDLTIKVVGHQWYWTYEYPEEQVRFDSYMKKTEELLPGDKRLLSVDNAVYVPVGKSVRLIVTADDVIHSWAIPAFGIKKDAVPGRLNETWFKAERTGTFYGQCSELCGVLHGFMPIEIKVVEESDYQAWLSTAKSQFATT